MHSFASTAMAKRLRKGRFARRLRAVRIPFRSSKSPLRPTGDAGLDFDSVDNWVHGSRSRGAVALKQAAKREFGLQGVAFTRREFIYGATELATARQTARRIYNQTQAELKRRGIRTMRLYRGIKGKYTTAGALESWTTDQATAQKFAGSKGVVLVDDVPVNRIWNGAEMDHWHSGKFGQQNEWIVMR